MYIKKSLLLVSSLLLIFKVQASDELKVNLQQADSLFLANNFYLLAASLQVEAQQAEIIQAKLYPNPVFTAGFNAYDPENRKAFHIGSTGQKEFEIEQLILLGGKRKSAIALAKLDANIAALEFQQLVQQLKFQLHSDLYKIGQQQLLIERYNEQLALLDTILTTHEAQVARGNIPLQELVRLKGVYLNLNNERSTLLSEYQETQANLQILLQTSQKISFDFEEEELNGYIKAEDFDRLLDEALSNQPDLLITQQNATMADQYWKYQKSLAVPDINLFAGYDQRGGVFEKEINAGVAIPLPLWDRNQGNIKAAALQIKASKHLLLAKENELLANLRNSFAIYEQAVAEYQKAKSIYNNDFDTTLKGISDNFQKRNISLIEFIDFFEAHNDVIAEMARIKTQLVTAAKQLNLIIGKDIY